MTSFGKLRNKGQYPPFFLLLTAPSAVLTVHRASAQTLFKTLPRNLAYMPRRTTPGFDTYPRAYVLSLHEHPLSL
ncbi:hypothetical protein DAEQUDRAFT_721893 [Daedalea quercina L-15889]|uniref:Uncharacterized protein n=1 Tax=Daedalea quercina L-15889 TaxID=1314783 RepID=A0A165TDW1_9APHY|nr:hypothetical protein DAEQUDRAFT_721893 [Daedalea quercina L-15889]